MERNSTVVRGTSNVTPTKGNVAVPGASSGRRGKRARHQRLQANTTGDTVPDLLRQSQVKPLRTSTHIGTLPNETLCDIFGLVLWGAPADVDCLGFHWTPNINADLLTLFLVCRRWHEIAADPSLRVRNNSAHIIIPDTLAERSPAWRVHRMLSAPENVAGMNNTINRLHLFVRQRVQAALGPLQPLFETIASAKCALTISGTVRSDLSGRWSVFSVPTQASSMKAFSAHNVVLTSSCPGTTFSSSTAKGDEFLKVARILASYGALDELVFDHISCRLAPGNPVFSVTFDTLKRVRFSALSVAIMQRCLGCLDLPQVEVLIMEKVPTIPVADLEVPPPGSLAKVKVLYWSPQDPSRAKDSQFMLEALIERMQHLVELTVVGICLVRHTFGSGLFNILSDWPSPSDGVHFPDLSIVTFDKCKFRFQDVVQFVKLYHYQHVFSTGLCSVSILNCQLSPLNEHNHQGRYLDIGHLVTVIKGCVPKLETLTAEHSHLRKRRYPKLLGMANYVHNKLSSEDSRGLFSILPPKLKFTVEILVDKMA